MMTVREFLPLLSKEAALLAGRGIGIALTKGKRSKKRPQAALQRASRKKNRRKYA